MGVSAGILAVKILGESFAEDCLRGLAAGGSETMEAGIEVRVEFGFDELIQHVHPM
jgi:hypothetical protein